VYHHGVALPLVVDGDDLQICRVAASVSEKRSRTADKGWSSNLGVGEGLTSIHCKNEPACYGMLHRASEL
jgi:hypothetical protein